MTLSVIVYGRNDTHGYNLSKRAVLSLNSIAACLTHKDDEIIFVDWNTPLGLPPFLATVHDELSARCQELLRIIVVSPAVHNSVREVGITKPTIEPIARNAAIRRARPENRWVLSTNTDILLDVEGGSLSALVTSLPTRYFGSPRFELPEWLWESFPRQDPETIQERLRSLALSPGLTPVVESYEWSKFDAPGDFQLIPRGVFESIGCFDEGMRRGWHVDSNASRRLSLILGPAESLRESVRVFHCNHNRVQTHFHQTVKVTNSLPKFVFDVRSPKASTNLESWGLRDEALSEITTNTFRSQATAALETLTSMEQTHSTIDFTQAQDRLLARRPIASLAFLADLMLTMPPGTSWTYIGAHDEIQSGLRDLLAGSQHELTFGEPLRANTLGKIVVVNLTPSTGNGVVGASRLRDLPDDSRQLLAQSWKSFLRAVNQEFSTLNSNVLFALINAEYNEFEGPAEELLALTPVQFYSGVRIGRARQGRRLQRNLRWILEPNWAIRKYASVLRHLQGARDSVVSRRGEGKPDLPITSVGIAKRRIVGAYLYALILRALLSPAKVAPATLLEPVLNLSDEPSSPAQES